MATFYTDTGSLGRLEVTGSTILSSSIGGTLQIQGSGSSIFSILGSKGSLLEISDTAGTGDIFTIQSASIDVLTVDSNKNVNISGSLTITGSLVLTQVLAGTASYATTASSADFLDGYHASSFTLNSQTASMNVLSSSYAATASLLLGSVVSASYALSASWAPGGAGGGTPAGNTGELQYNNAGSFGGAANVEVKDGNLNLISTTDPVNLPTASIIVYSKDIAGRQILKWVGPSGVDTPAQPNIMFNQVSLIGPGGGTTVGVIGCTITSVGTVSNPNITTTNLKTQTRRFVNTSAATAAALASTRVSSLECWRGNVAGQGGFYSVARFGLTTVAVGQRTFIGLDSNATVAPTNIDYLTSTTNAKIGMYETGSTGNWVLLWNAAAAAPTTASFGSTFPVNTTDLIEMILFAKPNDTAVTYRLTNLSTATAVSGSITTNLPASTTPLGRVIAGCNNATLAATAWDCSRFGLETDY